MKFTPEEIALLADRQIFPRKRGLMEKIGVVFARTEQLLKDKAIASQFDFPDACHLRPGKTGRGENLNGFPWMVHDYPRLFREESIFLFRTQCWFGHGFSCSLVVSGEHVSLLAGKPMLPGWTMASDDAIWDQAVQNSPDRFPSMPCQALRVTRDLGTDPETLADAAERAFHEILKVVQE